MEELNPSIWANLPEDIVYHIIDESDPSTQISWATTSWKFSPYACARIWHTFRLSQLYNGSYITRANFLAGFRGDGTHIVGEEAYGQHSQRKFYGIENPDNPSWPGSIVNGVLCKAKTIPDRPVCQQLAVLPCDLVRHLIIDNTYPTVQHDLDNMLSRLCRKLAGLTAITYDGPLYQHFLDILGIL